MDVPQYFNSQGLALSADELDDEGYAQSSNTSYVSSIASDVLRGVEENGRIYPSYGKHMYGIPIDEHEQSRNDMQHAKFLLLLDGHLHLAPIKTQQKFLDIGTGSGVWAIDMADNNPEAQVIGIDIAAVQPQWVPPNCQFEIEDAEEDWSFRENSFDFIYARELIMAIRDWPKLIKQSFDHLRPGGYLELAMTNPATCCDDGSLDLEQSSFAYSGKLFYEVAQKMGTPLDAMNEWEAQFAQAGFVDVQHFVLKVPMGPWPKDKRLKKIGLVELHSLKEGYEAYLLRGLTQVLGLSKEEATVIMAQGRREFTNPRHHTYVHYHIVFGRKPDPFGSSNTSTFHDEEHQG